VEKFNKIRDNAIRFVIITTLVALLYGFAERLYNSDYISTVSIFIAILTQFAALYLVQLYKSEIALWLSSIVLIIVITIIVTLGQGIHDIAIIVYPIILMITSVILNRTLFVTIVVLTVTAIAWLTFGAHYGYFIPKGHSPGSVYDFITVSVILVAAAVLSQIISNTISSMIQKRVIELKRVTDLSRQLQKSLEEKDVLIREMHHRVKNNLNILISLLEIERINEKNENTNMTLTDIQNRIYSIALVHEQLYNVESFTQISMQKYIPSLVEHVKIMTKRSAMVTIEKKIEPIELTVHQAVPCGIILSELLSNAIKHGLRNMSNLHIIIRFLLIDTHVCKIEISNDGVPLPDDFDLNKNSSVGLSLVHSLTRQLNGEMTVHQKNGVTFSIEFHLQTENQT
jgi:two-component sensor histidine kinase